MNQAQATGAASLLGIAFGAGTISSIAAGQCGAITVEVAGWGQAGYHQTTLAPSPRHARAIAAGNQNSFAVREDGGISGWGRNGFHRLADAPVSIVDAIGLSAGELHVAALLADDSVSCWGDNSASQCNVPPGLSAVLSLNAGRFHTVAADSSGAVWCWGRTAEGQCTPPADLGPVALVAAGRFHSVALERTGTVRCWGWNTDGQCNVPAGLAGVVAIGTGAVHTMAVRSDGGVVAWGSNASGQRNVPAGLGPVTAVDGGEGHSVALLADRTVACWGLNILGQATVPADLGAVVAIAAGHDHTLALEEGGTVRAWGGNEHAQRNVPIDLGSVRSIDVNTYHSIAVGSTGRVMAWGLNGSTACDVPPGLTGVVEVAAGDGHSMALDSDGRVTCWGVDSDGQSTVPSWVNNIPIARIRAGSYHSIAIEFLPGGLAPLRCWGRNDQGQCNGSGTLVRDADGGVNFTIAIRFDGQATGWGGNEHGQISVPPDPGTLLSVSAGDYHVLGLRSDGTVRAWGWNANGQANVPGGLGPVQAVAAGRTHSMALLATGLVRVWGGDPGGHGHFLVPHALEPFTAIRAGRVHDLAIRVGADSDADGIEDAVDNCPCTANADQADVDGDSVGDACDACPADPAKALAGACGCGVNDIDTDADRTPDCLDGCPRDPFNLDSDGDGSLDCLDGCPGDPAKTSPGVCGCGAVEQDTNANGIVDCIEDWTVVDPAVLQPGDVQPGDRFGFAIASDGEWLAVGGPGHYYPAFPIAYGNVGRVNLFRREGSTWTPSASLLPALILPEERFGWSVALDGTRLAVGVPGGDFIDAPDSGRVEVFEWDGLAWQRVALIRDAVPVPFGQFGWSVAIEGDLLAVGTPNAARGGLANSGEVSIHRRENGTWTRIATLGSVPETAGDRFGQSIAFGGAAASPLLVVGCPRDDQPSRADCGAVYLHRLDAGGIPVETTRLVGPAPLRNAWLGSTVTVDSGGTCIAAGAPVADPVGIGIDAGNAVLWTRDGSAWWGQTVSTPGQSAGERFGSSISLDPTGGLLLVGSPHRTVDGAAKRGIATLFRRFGGMSWDDGTPLAYPGGAPYPVGSQFGTSVAFAEGQALSGGPEHGLPFSGAVAVFAAPVSCVGDDADGDGYSAACDGCPDDISKISPDTCGCGVAETDSDLDATPDCLDACPLDPAKVAPGGCGCGVPDVDTDLDTILDCVDPDDDDDGVPDESDGCPLDPLKSEPGLCGCGASDADGDLDGTPDCLDACPDDPAKIAPGTCGCGVADDDLDADGLTDCLGLGRIDETAAIAAPDTLAGDDFGGSLASDGASGGLVLVVGSPLDDVAGKTDAGSVAIFTRSAPDEEWTFLERLSAPSVRAREQFGASVALDADTLVVGAPLSDVGGLVDAGAAYRYRRAGSGGWTLVDILHRTGGAAGDRFGQAVAARGGLVAVAAPKADPGGLADAGAVEVHREEEGTLVLYLVRNGESAGDSFGQSIAIATGGETPELVAGVPGDDEGSKTNCGAVQVLPIVDGGGRTRLLAPTPIRNAGLGGSVALGGGGGGGMIAAGAPLADLSGVGTDCGQVVVWTLSGGIWSGVEARPADHAAGERLGTSVAISDDGQWLVAGAPFDTVGGIAQRGSAALFARAGASWITFDRLTLPPAGTSASRFGTAVISWSGSIAVGAPKDAPPAGGTVREFTLPPP